MRTDDEIKESRKLNSAIEAKRKQDPELRMFEEWWRTQNSICKEIALSGWLARARLQLLGTASPYERT
jgi:hypothetical protein